MAGLVAGIAIAIPAAFGTVALARAAARMRTDAAPTRTDLIGRMGVVVTARPAPSRQRPAPLAGAERRRYILAEQQKVAERNAELKQRRLDTEVRKPADAERYRVEQDAEARKNATIAEDEARRQATIAAAEAASEQARLTGEGERSRRAALAEAVEREGAAEAAPRQPSTAEAEPAAEPPTS